MNTSNLSRFTISGLTINGVQETGANPSQAQRLVYSQGEVCVLLGVSPVTVWRLRRRGLLTQVPGIKRVVFAAGEVERFVRGEAA